jgi:transposase
MILYEKIKAAIKKGIDPVQIAAVFSVSENIITNLKQLMKERGELKN